MTIALVFFGLAVTWWLLGSRQVTSKRFIQSSEEPYNQTKSQWENWFSLNIVGESHYQKEVRRCSPGELVTFIREPENPRDEMAVRIASARGQTIGYLSSDRARWIAGDMDKGTTVSSHVDRITGEGRESRGIVLRVKLLHQPPVPKLRMPRRTQSKHNTTARLDAPDK